MNFQWKHCSMFNNFSTVGWNIMKPTNVPLLNEGSPTVPRVQQEAPKEKYYKTNLLHPYSSLRAFVKNCAFFFFVNLGPSYTRRFHCTFWNWEGPVQVGNCPSTLQKVQFWFFLFLIFSVLFQFPAPPFSSNSSI